MITAAGVRQITFDAAAGDVIAVKLNVGNLVGQHGAVVTADCVITEMNGFTKGTPTWSVNDTLLTVVVTAPDVESTNIQALDIAIKFSTLNEILNFEVYFDLV